MAVYNKIGSRMRQSSEHISSMPSMLTVIRAMSSSKVFVGGLSYHVDNAALREAFSGFGDVNDARIVTERDSGRSKGFGFVTFADSESASSAVAGLDGQELNGRKIRVSIAEDKPRNSYGDGRGGGYSGAGF